MKASENKSKENIKKGDLKQKEQIVWFRVCPVCKKTPVFEIPKRPIVLKISKTEAKCSSCESIFRETDNGHILLYSVPPLGREFYARYGNKPLSAREWNNITLGGMSDEEQYKYDLSTWFQGLSSGHFTLRLNGPCLLPLKKGEQFQFTISNVFLYEMYSTLKFKEAGSLMLTNKRMIFLGNIGTLIDIPLKKIQRIDPIDDGFRIIREGKKRTEFFKNIDNNCTFTITIANRTHQIVLTKEIVVAAIRNLF